MESYKVINYLVNKLFNQLQIERRLLSIEKKKNKKA